MPIYMAQPYKAWLLLARPYMESVPFAHDSGPIGQIPNTIYF